MGAKQSSLQSAENDDDSTVPDEECHCFFLSKLAKPKSKGIASDPMGTPLPMTPVHERRKREKILEEARNNPVMMSRYDGLEKETEAYYKSPGLISPRQKSAMRDEAKVHEGKDAEKLMQQKYELMEVLGIGSTSTVHRCVNRTTMLDYACKIIDKRTVSESFQGMMEQFHVEIDSLKQLQHPNIIRLYDVYITDEKIFIVVELMEGGELFDYVVQKGTLTEVEASGIVRAVTSAIVYMHKKNIIHRDLKPENLLLRHKATASSQIEVKIIDFGLSKCLATPETSTFLGTRGYLAPEMLQRLDYDKAIDTWALGVIVYILLCGCLPFDDDSQAINNPDLVKAKFVLRFPRWAKNLSPSAQDLLSHLLDVNPKTRYTAETVLHHKWVTGETANKKLLPSPGRIQKSPKSTKKHRRTNSRDYNIVQQNGYNLVAPKRTIVRKKSI